MENNFGTVLSDRIMQCEKILKSYLPEKEGFQKTIFDAMEYSVMAGGKRIRPVIMEETYRVFGGDEEVIKPFMAAMEYIHTYSLVHDDLPCMDNDEYRRGKKTTWSVYGDDMGVLCGDALLNYAFETAVKAFEITKYPQRAAVALKILSGKAGVYGMLGGQVVDVELTDKPMSAEQLDFIFRLKTGALIESSMMIGAVLAGADEIQVRDVEEIAAKVGMAFQIRDDILDCISTTEVLGKPVGSDEKNHKTTYVSLYGMEEADRAVNRLMNEAMNMLNKLPGDTSFLEYIFELLVNRNK